MTRDEILALPAGRDLDALVAQRVFGLQVEWHTSWDGNPQPFCRALRTKYDQDGWVPMYSTDIAAAWQVVEALALRNRESFFQFHLSCIANKVRAIWGVEFGPISATADTAPLAISRAALLDVMGV